MAISSTTEQRYQQVAIYYTKSDIYHILKRQWKFIKEPTQSDILTNAVFFTIGTVGYCTYKGIKIGAQIADSLCLKDNKRNIVIVCGGGTGFATGVGISVLGGGLAIEHSKRIEEWKKVNINQGIENLMKEEFREDPIWAQLTCPISYEPMFFPVRTPTGSVCEHSELMKAADENGMIKDIYNQTIPFATEDDPEATRVITFSIDACVKDPEMMIVINKRFRHLAFDKSKEDGLSRSTKDFLLEYRNSLGEFTKEIYMMIESKIFKKKQDMQSRPNITEEEADIAEALYKQEIEEFKSLFGANPFANIDWSIQRDWMETLNKRWREQHS